MRRNRTIVTVTALVLFCGLTARIALGQTPGTLTEEQQRAVQMLDHPSWEMREIATAELMAADPTALPYFVSLSSGDISPDARIRLREICEELYRIPRFGPSRAFLGIQNNPVRWAANEGIGNIEPILPVGHAGLRVTNVIDSTAAERAGLRPNDLVIAIDDHRVFIDKLREGLTERIGAKRPGAICKFTVIRGAKHAYLDMSPLAGTTPHDFVSVEIEIQTSADNPVLAPHTCGLRIAALGALNTDYGLKVGDVITTLNMMPFKPDTALEQWRSWLGGTFDVRAAVASWENSDQPLPPIGTVSEKAQALGVLRGGELLEIEARLGRWPRHLLRDFENPANRALIIQEKEIRAAFDEWWNQQLAPADRQVDDILGASLFWRMELTDEQ